MADFFASHPNQTSTTGEKDEEVEPDYENNLKNYDQMMQCLPKAKGWIAEHLIQYQGFWFSEFSLKGALLTQNHYMAQTNDIFLASYPKSGTTWLKAIAFALLTRDRFNLSDHSLLVTGPHDCVPFIEYFDYQKYPSSDIKTLSSPRLLATHLPYSLLPKSVTDLGCRMIYICRNPKDVFVSLWQFTKKLRYKDLPPLTLEDAFDLFCKGISYRGPIWEHVLGYYKTSLQTPNKVLFLKYEDMKREPLVYLKIISEFMGTPFTLEEKKKGVAEEIVKLCSFESLSDLEVNKNDIHQVNSNFEIENQLFFRKGQMGDWRNYLTMDMSQRLDQIMEEKFGPFGLNFEDLQSWSK